MKNLKSLFAAAALVAVAAACTNTTNTDSSADSIASESADKLTAQTAHVDIAATKTDTTGGGTADFSVKGNGVEMKLVLNIPKKANQTVAVHFHEHGDCGDMGKEAHGHWNPSSEKHGKWGDAEYHSGDIGNIALDADGKAEFTLESDRWTIGGDDKTNILNRAIIVHSGVDDYKSQPTGNSGSRIGCGIIMAAAK